MGENFDKTDWSLLFKIRNGTETEATEALDVVCRTYWLPLYEWLRRTGHSVEDSEDLIQGFFVHAQRRKIFQKAVEGEGLLRTWLLRCLRNFLADERERESAQKRAGRKNEISLDFMDTQRAEAGIQLEVQSPDADPSQLYERRWARAILNSALARLRERYCSDGNELTFEVLSPRLSDSGEQTEVGRYAEAAARMEVSEGAARQAYSRMRHRFRQAFREEVARTLLPGDDLEEEMRYLARVLG